MFALEKLRNWLGQPLIPNFNFQEIVKNIIYHIYKQLAFRCVELFDFGHKSRDKGQRDDEANVQDCRFQFCCRWIYQWYISDIPLNIKKIILTKPCCACLSIWSASFPKMIIFPISDAGFARYEGRIRMKATLIR